jgi:hypothetical protein
VHDDESLRPRLREARRKMMAGVPLTTADREAMEAFARWEDDPIPHGPLTRAAGACAVAFWLGAHVGSIAGDHATFGRVGERVYWIGVPLALGAWSVYFFLRRRERNAWNDAGGSS